MNAVVVLVEPAGPLNIGSVARLCANFGVGELRLVAPRCDHLSEEAMLMAVHGQALLQGAVVVPDRPRNTVASKLKEPPGAP